MTREELDDIKRIIGRRPDSVIDLLIAAIEEAWARPTVHYGYGIVDSNNVPELMQGAMMENVQDELEEFCRLAEAGELGVAGYREAFEAALDILAAERDESARLRNAHNAVVVALDIATGEIETLRRLRLHEVRE